LKSGLARLAFVEEINTSAYGISQISVVFSLITLIDMQRLFKLPTGGFEIVSKVPRALAFLDLPQGTQIIPTAAEFMSGKILTFFDKMAAADDGRKPPVYPSHVEDEATYRDKDLSTGIGIVLILDLNRQLT
jgi:hypothetical protein